MFERLLVAISGTRMGVYMGSPLSGQTIGSAVGPDNRSVVGQDNRLVVGLDNRLVVGPDNTSVVGPDNRVRTHC